MKGTLVDFRGSDSVHGPGTAGDIPPAKIQAACMQRKG